MERRQPGSYLHLHTILVFVVCLILGLTTLCDANIVPKEVGVSQTTTTVHGQLPPAKTPAYDVVNLAQKAIPSADLSATQSSKDVDNQEGYNGNELKPTKDDWYYDPDGEDEKDEVWDEEENKNMESYEKPGMVYHASVAVVKGIADSDVEDNDGDDDTDDENYDFWAKFPDNDKLAENEVDDVQETNEGAEQDEDFDEKLLEGVVDDALAKKNKPPTAPSKMVLFYTWMILAILIMVVGISTYQARCKGFHFNANTFRHQTREDRKRLVDHEYT